MLGSVLNVLHTFMPYFIASTLCSEQRHKRFNILLTIVVRRRRSSGGEPNSLAPELLPLIPVELGTEEPEEAGGMRKSEAGCSGS